MCPCKEDGRRRCYARRYDIPMSDLGTEECTCSCHDWEDDADEEPRP